MNNEVTQVTQVQKIKLYDYIAEILGNREMTAREIAVELRDKYHILNGMRQDVAPRLTELELSNVVEVVTTKIDVVTRKRVSVYRMIRGSKNEHQEH